MTESSSLRHLLLSFPELDIAHNGNDIVDALVEGAVCQLLSRQGVGKMLMMTDVATAINDLAGLVYEQAELVASFERLESRGRLSFRDDTHRSFVYDEGAYRVNTDSFRMLMSAWDSVRTTWLDELQQRHDIEEGQAAALWDALDAFSAELINAYGAEAAAFLYVQDAAGQSRFYEALSLRLPDIAETISPELREVALVEFPRFFDPSNAARTDYLTGRLRASFFFHLLSLDPSASELVREHVSDKILYIDSNFLLRLLGFDGPAQAFAAITAVEISRKLNCKLVIARETVDEYIHRVRANVAHLKATPIHREAYLRVAASHPSDEGEFMAVFYRELLSGQVKTVDDFARRWTNVHVHLKLWGIEVDESAKLGPEEEKSENYLDLLSDLTNWHRGERSPEAIRHDAFMLRFMRRIRGRGEPTPGRTKYWLLTFDRQLTRHDAYHSTEAEIPTLLLAESWLQIARPFLPRTDDYAKSFVAMLRHPLLFHSAKVPFAHMAQALSRLERYDELPIPLVSAIVADEQFTRNFAGAKTEEDARQLLELKIGEVAGDVIAHNESLRDSIERAQSQIANLQKDIDILRDVRDAAEREKEHSRVAAAEATEGAARRVIDAEQRAAQTADERIEIVRADYEERLSKGIENAASTAAAATEQRLRPIFATQIRQLLRWLMYGTLVVIVTSFAAAFLVRKWHELTSMQVAVTLGWLAVIWVLLLAIPKGWSRAWGITVGVLAAVGVVLTSLALWGPSADRDAAASDASNSSLPTLVIPSQNPPKARR